MIKPNGSITGSLSGTSSYSRRALTASYALNASGGSISYITGSPVVGQYIVVSGSNTTQYALIQNVTNPEHLLVSVNGVVQNYSSSYTVTGSTLNFYQPYDDGDEIDVRFLNGGTTVQTGSIAKQTVWTNVTSGSTNTITGLSLSSNKWDVSVVEEWDAATLDQYYNSCSLLCHFDSINPAGRFIDNSRNNFKITSSGDAKLSTSQYKFGGASAYFDGVNDYLLIPDNNAFELGSSDFTLESFVYFVTLPSSNGYYSTIISKWTSSNNSYFIYLYNSAGTYQLYLTYSTNGTSYTNLGVNWTPNVGQWYHIACVRSSTNVYFWVNGVQQGATQSISGTLYNGTAPLEIGANLFGSANTVLNGYLDELRITKGVARYTANFTPPSAPFPNSRNQVLTRYVGLVGGIDDKYVDYGVQKLSNSSLKLTRLTYPNQPIVGSGSLSGSVSRVYVNVLDYDNVSISGSISNAVTASYAVTSSYAVTASYALTNITECGHLASTVVYTLPNANIVIVPFNTAIILQNITINATASPVGGIEAYHWRHSTTGIFRLVYQVRATSDVWNMISVCKNNNTALPVGNGYRSGIPGGGEWGILFECLYRVTDISDRFGLFHWAVGNAGTLLAHSVGNPPSTFFVTPDIGTAPTTGYYNSITITKV
jgi:hypothetical protein